MRTAWSVSPPTSSLSLLCRYSAVATSISWLLTGGERAACSDSRHRDTWVRLG